MAKSSLRVLFLAAEADPLVKVGGLGDVAGSLPLALRSFSTNDGQALQVDARLAIPFHGGIRLEDYPVKQVCSFTVPHQSGPLLAEALLVEVNGLPVYLIRGPLIQPDFPIYTSDAYADGLKFTFFSLASLELTRQLHWAPDILHANDWHTAPAVYALSRIKRGVPFFRNTASLLGLHNLPYMGWGAGPALHEFGLPPASGSALPWWAQDMPLGMGLLTADRLVAVSPSYAREILTPEFGVGLEGFLLTRQASLSGILNGLDRSRWDPETDNSLEANYNAASLEARQANKSSLQRELGLPPGPRRPLLAMVTRLDYQKGVDLLPEALRLLAATPIDAGQPWQVVILGTGDPAIESAVRRLEAEFPLRVRAAIGFDAALSRRIYASADMLLLPSRYEPCGMAQMIAMRYGCVPVACATGGLKDTIQDYSHSADSTGFLFNGATAEGLAEALLRALQTYANPLAWNGLQQRGMARDFSWLRSARQYLDLYQTLVK